MVGVFCLVKIVGFEPTTSCMSSKRSDQLSYTFIGLLRYIGNKQIKSVVKH